MTYPEGSFSPIGFIFLFFLFFCLVQFARGLVAGLNGRPEIYQKKMPWFRIFCGLFLIYLITNWDDITANTLRGYEEGMQTERQKTMQFFKDLQK